MKIAHYKCSLKPDDLKTLGMTIDPLDALDDWAVYEHEILVWNNIYAVPDNLTDLFPHLKVLVNWGTDDSNMDAPQLAKKGILVKKVDFYATEALAEYIISLMLFFERRHLDLLSGQKTVGAEIYGKKVGILGLGKIGFRAASILKRSFGCQIYYNSRTDKKIPGYRFASIPQLLQDCDYVIIASKSGQVSIDISDLKLNPDLVIVNIARDTILPAKDIVPMLVNKRLRGYVSDVDISYELPDNLPDSMILFPHKGYLTKQSAAIKRNILSLYLAKPSVKDWKIYITRHGETAWNKAGKLQGRQDSPLTKLGVEHAKNIAKHLKDKNIKRIYCSPLGRARQTADEIARATGLTVTVVPEFAEMSFGVFEGKDKSLLKKVFADFFEDRKSNDFAKLFNPYPEGESYYDLYIRSLPAFLNITASNETCVIVGHESINRMMRGIALEKELTDMIHSRQKNNEVVCLNMADNSETLELI